MKITKIEVLKVKTVRRTWRPVYCRIYTDEGIYGDGEAALAYGRAADAGFAAVKEFAGLVIGMDPLKNEVIWDKLYKTTFWGQNGGPVIFAAIGAIDMALWDIKGKFFNAPIHQLLGGARRDKLRSYASQLQNGWENNREDYVFQYAPEDFADAAKKAVAEGYDAVKFDFFEKKPPIIRMRKGGGSNGTGGTGGYGRTGGSRYGDIRSMISTGRIQDAEVLLDGVPAASRDAEWFFLKGSVLYRKGWLEDAYNNFATACRMDPSNGEYRAAVNQMNTQRQTGGYRTSGRPAGGGCSACDVCNALICTDCCCECMGGDFISCC